MIRVNLGHPNLVTRTLTVEQLTERMPLGWAERFLERVDVAPGPLRKSECWYWTGAATRDGYGQVRTTSHVPSMAYRVALETVLERPILPGFEADHRCRNVKCVRPRHLQEITKGLNLKRMRQGLKEDRRLAFVRRQFERRKGIYG